MTELLTCNREGWARDSAREKIDPFEVAPVNLVDIAKLNLPGWAIKQNSRYGMPVYIYPVHMLKASLFQPKCLPASADADFCHSQL